MKTKHTNLYIYVLAGAVGSAIMLFFLVWHAAQVQTSISYLGIFGALFVLFYLNFLEREAGMSTKLIWLKSGVSMMVFILLATFITL